MGSIASTAAPAHGLSTLLVAGVPLTAAHRARLEPFFSTIRHQRDRNMVSDDDFSGADAIFGHLPPRVQHLKQVPDLRLVQLANAGSDEELTRPIFKEDGGAKQITMTTAAGVHTGPIPQYFIMTVLALYHRLQALILIGQNEKRWATAEEVGGSRMFIQELRGKTVGILGYGHIGRESARLAHAFGASILAATSGGCKKAQDGYIIPGTGDPDGSLPAAWHSTKDATSFASFLSRSDVVLVALPSTPATRHILSAATLAHLRPSALLVNIGRGDLVDTAALVSALDAGRLAGAALDVTDPEPLPNGHTLYGRANVILTPHLAGRTEQYFDLAIDIFVSNLERLKEGKELLNVVDPEKGY